MGWVVNTTPRPLYPRERPGTLCIGGWVGHQGRSGRMRKISATPVFDPQTLQSGAIPARQMDAVWRQILDAK